MALGMLLLVDWAGAQTTEKCLFRPPIGMQRYRKRWTTCDDDNRDCACRTGIALYTEKGILDRSSSYVAWRSPGERIPCTSTSYGLDTNGTKGKCFCFRVVVPRRHACPTTEGKRRVALAFFGINRSLNRTIESLESKVIDPLRRRGVDVDIYFHTYSILNVSSVRALETGVPIGGADELIELLGPRAWAVTSQDDFDKTMNISSYFRFPIVPHQRYKFRYYYPKSTIKNLLRQLNSIKSVTALLATPRSRARDYAAVIMMRPDLLHLDEINVNDVLSVAGTRNVLVPYWHSYYGMNDRILIAAPNIAVDLGNRFAFAKIFAESEPLHSERLTRFAADAVNAVPRPLRMRAIRIRATGHPEERDLCLYNCTVTIDVNCSSVCRGGVPVPSNALNILADIRRTNNVINYALKSSSSSRSTTKNTRNGTSLPPA